MTKERNQLIAIGDVHGEYETLNYLIHTRYKITDAYLCLLGDIGLGFHKENYYKTALGKLNESLKRNNNYIYAIAGNHDDPAYFKETNNPFSLSNITLLADYSELELLGKKILCVGGAISVDRIWRKEGKSYWKDEGFVFDESFFSEGKKQYDIVLTHTRPGVCGSFKGFGEIEHIFLKDPILRDELIKEAADMDRLYEMTRPTLHLYGHFHKSMITQHENTTFRCLDINEFWAIPS